MCGEPDELELSEGGAPRQVCNCWRCELPVPADAVACPHCAAKLRTDGQNVVIGRHAAASDPIRVLFVSFALLLATGIAHSLVLSLRFDDADIDSERRRQILLQILLVEAVDSIIVLGVFVKCRACFAGEVTSVDRRLRTWIAAAPLLVALLGANLAYHALLRKVLLMPQLQDDLSSQFDLLLLLAICIQPAIVEEAYCRGFALSVLRGIAGLHSAVWISAVMFGLMHVAVPLSIPYLILLGACLGYVRHFTGTIWLPVVLHFLHNLAISLLDVWLAT